MNNRGFTLIELLATIVLLALVLSIGSIAITSIIKNAKDKNYDLLITNIRDGAEVYYQECKYANNSGITCRDDMTITLGELLKYGYIKGNDTDSSSKYIITNPHDDENIGMCTIKITYSNGEVSVDTSESGGSCPTHCDFNPKDTTCVKTG